MTDWNEELINNARQGNIKTVAKALKQGAEINAKDKNGWTALMWASANGHKHIVKLLLRHGADITIKAKLDNNAIGVASMWNHEEIVKILRRAQMKYTDWNRELIKGIVEIDFNKVRKALKNGAKINYKNDVGCPAIVYASARGNKKIVKFLLANGADINMKDINGKTALIWASRYGHTEIVKLLRKAGAKE